MFLTRHARSLVALVAVFALLFCHTAGATRLLALDHGVTHASTTLDGCHSHSSSGADQTPQNAWPTPCDTATSVSDAYKLPAITLAVVALQSDPLCRMVARTAAFGTAPAAFAGAPPPLHVLHCKLLN